MPQLRTQKRRNNADRCLPILLRVRKLQNCIETTTRRLLCLLQLWEREMSTNSTRREMLLTEEKKPEPLTMYIQNRRNSSKFNGCSPLQHRNGLTSLKPEIAYFAYTKRWPRYLPAVVILANGAKTTSHIERRYLPSGRYHRPT